MAHRDWDDRKRREINLSTYKVKEILPSYFQEDYPTLVTFLEKYFDQLDSDSPSELLRHIYEKKDIIQTDLDLLPFIEDELLLGQSYFKGFSNPRTAAEFSNNLYRSKGSKYSIEQFFKMFYQEDPDVVFGKDLIFKLNDSASTVGVTTDKRITNNRLYQIFGLLIKTGLSIEDWRTLYKLFAHPSGMYLEGLVQIAEAADFDLDQMPNVRQDSAPPLAVHGFATISPLASIETTEIGFGDSANDQYRTYINYNLDSSGLSIYQTATIEQLAGQYGSLIETIEANSPTLDEDSDAAGTSIDLTNTIDRMDQERYFWWDPDSADYEAQIIARDDSAE